MTPRSLLAFCREKGVRIVEIRFAALDGQSERLQISVENFVETIFETGLVFTPRRPNLSDCDQCLVIPLADTAYLSPLAIVPTLVLVAQLQDADTLQEDHFDTREILNRADEAWKNISGGCTVQIGQTCQVLFLESMDGSRTAGRGTFQLQALHSLQWNAPASSNGTSATDAILASETPASQVLSVKRHVADLCSEIIERLTNIQIVLETVSYNPQQPGFVSFHLAPNTPARAADVHLIACEMISAVASNYGLTACFLPLISPEQPTVGWDLQLSLWKDDETYMAGGKTMGLSDKAAAAVAGLLSSLPALVSLTNPSQNSFRRFATQRQSKRPLETGLNVNRHWVAVQNGDNNPKGKTIHLSFPDQTSNPYLALAGVLMAMVHGVEEHLTLDPAGGSTGEDGRPSNVDRMPRTLDRAISKLKSNRSFLTNHDVFSQRILRAWTRYLKQERIAALDRYPSINECLVQYR